MFTSEIENEAAGNSVESRRELKATGTSRCVQRQHEDSPGAVPPLRSKQAPVCTAGPEREAAPARTNIRWEPLGRDDLIWPPFPLLRHPTLPTAALGFPHDAGSGSAFFSFMLCSAPALVVSRPGMSILARLRRVSWTAGVLYTAPESLRPLSPRGFFLF